MSNALSEETLAAHARVTRQGGLEGFLAALALSLPASLLAQSRSRSYAALPLPLKTSYVVIALAAGSVIQAERRGLQFEHAQWSDTGAGLLRSEAEQRAARYAALSPLDRALTTFKQHRSPFHPFYALSCL